MLEMFRNMDLAFPATHFQAFTRVFSFFFLFARAIVFRVFFWGGLSWYVVGKMEETVEKIKRISV